MNLHALLLTGAFLSLTGGLSAQQSVNLPLDLPGEGGPILPASGNEPFVDHENQGAKALAEAEGITVGEATAILRLRHGAGLARKLLDDSGLAGLAGIAAADDGRVVIYVKGGSPIAGSARALVASALGSNQIEIRQVGKSIAELQRQAESLADRVGTADGVIGFRLNVASNSLSVLASDVSLARDRMVREGAGELEIVQSEPIELTQTVYAGYANNNGTSGCPTFGFMVINQSTGVRGLTSAAHADTNDSSTSIRYPGTFSCSGGTTVSRQGWYLGGSSSTTNVELGLDVAWYRNSSQTYPPQFFDGTNYRWVTGVRYSVKDDPVCKFGRASQQVRCGRVTGDLVYSSDANNRYGWMSEARADPGVTDFNPVGDSGGPVWYSSGTAVGFVHARIGNDRMLFTDAAALQQRNLPIRIAYCGSPPCYS